MTVFVGGNNAGKSTMLSDVVRILSSTPGHRQDTLGVSHLTIREEGGVEGFQAWLREHTFIDRNPGEDADHYSRPKGNGEIVRVPGLLDYWTRRAQYSQDALGPLFSFLVHVSDIGQRISAISGSTQQRASLKASPHGILNLFEENSNLFREFSALSERIFRRPLTLDFLVGQLQLRVGRLDMSAPPIDRITSDYREAMHELPLLSSQGDGMRSLLGLLLPIITASYPIIIMDEPEAFLHPPQAYELGKAISLVARDRRVQVLAASHDRNFLVGLLQPEVPISVVRLERTEGPARAVQLASSQLMQLWQNPIIRYSNILDGLFHRVVVIAEGDRDCRFFGAALDAANDEKLQNERGLKGTSIPPSEVLFVPSNGKAGMAEIARTLQALGVSVIASPDLDVVNEETTLSNLVQALGGKWEDFTDDYRTATRRFREKQGPATAADVLTALRAVLESDLTATYDAKLKKAVTAQMRTAGSPWEALKLHGMSAFRTGQERAAATRLIAALAQVGIVVVQDGELESLAPDLEVKKGARWLPAALEAGAHMDTAAQGHVHRVIAAAELRFAKNPADQSTPN
ncbi:ATP-dependent nuclease [Micromonospora sp. URMC 105]|uniref:ATP-dependent nuclease n=1 Tax=Micromonospora sp. URMC 105 TaxID=3423413 RepID=UPI003F1BBCFF